MAFNFGAFQQGVSTSKKEISAQRKDNASLYSQFVKDNPNSNASDRESFASNLTGNNKGYRAALPSRAMMESNVAAYQQKKGAAAAATARKTKLQNIKIVGEASNYMSDLLQTMDGDAALSNVELVFGDLLDKDMLPAVQSSADRMGWQKYSKAAAPLLQSFKANPNQLSLDALAMDGMSSVYGDRLVKSQAGTLSNAKNTALAAAEAQYFQLGAGADVNSPEALQILQNSLQAKYNGLLTPEELAPTWVSGQAEFERRTGENNVNQTARVQGIANIVAANIINSDTVTFSTKDEALATLQNQIAAEGGLDKFVSDEARQTVENAWKDRNLTNLDIINQKEAAEVITKTAALTTDRQLIDVSASDLEVIFLQGLVGEDARETGAIAAQRLSAEVEASSALGVLMNTAIDLNIDVKDKGFVDRWVRSANQLRSNQASFEDVSIPLDREHFLRALDEMAFSGQSDANSIAMRRALINIGLNNFAGMDEDKYGQFAQSVNEELGKIVKAKTDIFSNRDTTLDNRIQGAAQVLSTSENSFDENALGELQGKAAGLLNPDMSDPTNQNTYEQINSWGQDAQAYVGKLISESRRLTNEAARLEQITLHPHFAGDKPMVTKAFVEIEKLKARAQQYILDSQAVAAQGNKLKQMQSTAHVAPITPTALPEPQFDEFGDPIIGPNGQQVVVTPTRNTKDIATAMISGNVSTAITDAQTKGQDLTRAQIFQMVYTLAQEQHAADPSALDMLNRYGVEMFANGKTQTGEYAFGPFLEALNSPSALDRATFGNEGLTSTVPDYETFMREIYTKMGLPMPTATEARIMIEGNKFHENLQQGAENIGGAIAQRWDDVFN